MLYTYTHVRAEQARADADELLLDPGVNEVSGVFEGKSGQGNCAELWKTHVTGAADL